MVKFDLYVIRDTRCTYLFEVLQFFVTIFSSGCRYLYASFPIHIYLLLQRKYAILRTTEYALHIIYLVDMRLSNVINNHIQDTVLLVRCGKKFLRKSTYLQFYTISLKFSVIANLGGILGYLSNNIQQIYTIYYHYRYLLQHHIYKIYAYILFSADIIYRRTKLFIIRQTKSELSDVDTYKVSRDGSNNDYF